MSTKRFVTLIVIALVALSCARYLCAGEIHDASGAGEVSLEKVKSLLKADPKLVESKDDQGKTALHWAASAGRKDIVLALLGTGANKDAKDDQGCTPLHEAAKEDKPEVVSLLAAKGADRNVSDDRGWTAMHHAAWFGYNDVVELLLTKGAMPSRRPSCCWRKAPPSTRRTSPAIRLSCRP